MKTLLRVGIVVLILSLVASPIHAQSWEFLNEQLNITYADTTGVTLPVVFMYSEWNLGYYENHPYNRLDWYATSSIRTFAQSAINSWKTTGSAPPWTHNWSEINSKGSTQLDLRFIDVDSDSSYGQCSNPAAVACFSVSNYVRDGTRGVYYWNKALIRVKFSKLTGATVTNSVKQAIVSHELGHVFGLADRYASSGGCQSPTETTVMERFTVKNGQWQSCAGANVTFPQTVDTQRINSYFEQGQYIQPSSGSWIVKSGSYFSSKWRDEAWTEFMMRHELEKYQNGAWVKKNDGTHYRDIGSHRRHVQRVLDTSDSSGSGRYNVSSYGSGLYRICAHPVFGTVNGQEVQGNRNCSTSAHWP